MTYTPGMVVGVRCTVTSGAFPDERLVTFEAIDGTVSGFVKPEEIETIGGEPHLRAVVRAVASDRLTVLVNGSFFTTTGIAYLTPSAEVQPIAASESP